MPHEPYIQVRDDFDMRTRIILIKVPITWELLEGKTVAEVDEMILDIIQELVRTRDLVT